MTVKCKCFEHTTSLFLLEGIPQLFEKQFDKTSENVKGNKEHIFASTRARANIWTDQSQSDLEERPFWAMAAMSTDPGKGQLLKLKREIFCVLWQIANCKFERCEKVGNTDLSLQAAALPWRPTLAARSYSAWAAHLSVFKAVSNPIKN